MGHGLETSSVELGWRHCSDIDAIETAHVDGDHRASVRIVALRERSNAAGRAKQVMNDMLVELVVRQRLAARQQPKLGEWHECQDRSALLANGTIAGDQTCKIRFDLVANQAAVAAARPGFRFRHTLRLSVN